MRNKNDIRGSFRGGLTVVSPVICSLLVACTTAQQSASASTSTSPSPGAGAGNTSGQVTEYGNPPANGPSATEVRAVDDVVAGNIQVEDVANQPLGAKVTVAGVFMGFNGACLSDAPSRSAWHLAASKEPKARCVYVDGPFPPGLSPALHAGTNITLAATVNQLGNVKYLVSTGQ